MYTQFPCEIVCKIYERLKKVQNENKQANISSMQTAGGHVHKISDPFLMCCANLSPRHWNTGLVSSGVSLTSWGEGASLALVGHPSSDDITIKIPYEVDALLHWPASHPIFSYWVG